MDKEELKKLTAKVLADPTLVEDLPYEQVSDLSKYLNPFGQIVSAEESWASISVINWREEYIRKFNMMCMVGYLFRTLEEYIPEKEIEHLETKWGTSIDEANERHKKQLAECTDEAARKELIAAHEKHIWGFRRSLEMERKQIIQNVKESITRFLNRNFNYNPDYHLRGVHSENLKDPERKPTAEVLKEAMATAKKTPEVEAKIKDNPDTVFKYLKDNVLFTYQSLVHIIRAAKGIITTLSDGELDTEDKSAIISREHTKLLALARDMKRLANPLAAADVLPAVVTDPPVDVFHHLNRYITNHYEQLREAFSHLHNEKPDIEFSIIYYAHHDSLEEARAFRLRHRDEFRTSVFDISNNGITLLGPFKENRARVDFYNKNTEIMKMMMDQMEADHKLGKDLMEKEVKAKKAKNIIEAGPAAPGLAEYSKTMTTAQAFGAKKVLTKEEEEKLVEERRKRMIEEAPEDAIPVEIYYPKQGEDGEVKLEHSHFYTQAEAPLHIQEGSQYRDKYQPKRAPGEKITLAPKTVVDRHGNKIQIQDLARQKK